MTQHIKNIIRILTVSTFIITTTRCTQNEKTDTYKFSSTGSNIKLRLLTYGGPPNLERISARKIVEEKWGIEYFSVADCEVSKALTDSVKKCNALVEKVIQEKYGKDWYTKFRREVDEELSKQKRAASLLDKEERIIKKRNELKKADYGIYYSFYPIDNNQYNISAMGWGQINGENLIYFKYLVDIKKKSVKLVSDSVTRE